MREYRRAQKNAICFDSARIGLEKRAKEQNKTMRQVSEYLCAALNYRNNAEIRSYLKSSVLTQLLDHGNKQMSTTRKLMK